MWLFARVSYEIRNELLLYSFNYKVRSSACSKFLRLVFNMFKLLKHGKKMLAFEIVLNLRMNYS